jgi:pimeloyl-ACP methyl ester carboxylesterase
VDTPTTPRFTPARVVALALIGLVGLGLGYVHFAPDVGPVSVPEGARAGDLALEPCSYATEDGDYAADCGTLVVPENRADPDSPLIALPVRRIRARSPEPGEPVFWLEGGPGQSNMDFDRASRFAQDRDFVFVGYRGWDGSARLDCPEVSSALKHSRDYLSMESSREYGAAFRACADRLTGEGFDLASYGLTQQVDDMEAARVAFGYDRINLLGQSAGTRTAMIYAWRYPESIQRSVMLAVNPPGNFLVDPQTTDQLIDRYAELCAQHDSCRDRTDDLAAVLRQTAADTPDRWLFLPIKPANVRIFSLYGLMETTSNAQPSSAASTLDSWLSAAEGDASGLWFASLLADVMFPDLFVWGQYAAAASADTPWLRDYFSADGPDREFNLGYAASAFAWGRGQMFDSWPVAREVDEYSRVRTSQVEALLISGELDFVTPPQPATQQLLPYLPNGHQVVLGGFGHVASFWTEQPEAGTTLINTFFDRGEVDDSLYTPQSVDLTPSVRHTTIAKFALGVMLGLAAMTVLSLLWMARHIYRRGHFGRKASAVLRSVCPLVLGFGGWFLGALIVLATMPTVFLSNELLSVLAAGAPIGLGVYLAWVHRDWPYNTKSAGILGAMGAALLGAWFGVNSTTGLLAPVTAALGAAAAANLALIALDIYRAELKRQRPTPPIRVDPAGERVGA